MKLFALIFGIYVLMLSFVPCTDSIECHNNNRTEIAVANHNDHQHEQEHCPPLCHCACCSINITQPAQPLLIGYKKSDAVVEKHFPVYAFTYLNANLSAVWQPPRA